MKKIFIILLIFLNGCFFGIFQRPKTLGEGNFDISIGASLQFTANPYDRQDIEKAGYHLYPNLGFIFAYGVMNGFDVGFAIFGAGIGPFFRFDLYKKKIKGVENEFLLAPYILYDPFFSKSVAARIDAIYSWQINKNFETFIFYQLYYHPYFQNFLDPKPLGYMGNGFYNFIGFGGNINIYFERKYKNKTPDLRFNLEFGFLPVYLQNNQKFIPVFNFGLGFGGDVLFKCRTERGRVYCPSDILLNLLYLIFLGGSR